MLTPRNDMTFRVLPLTLAYPRAIRSYPAKHMISEIVIIYIYIYSTHGKSAGMGTAQPPRENDTLFMTHQCSSSLLTMCVLRPSMFGSSGQ